MIPRALTVLVLMALLSACGGQAAAPVPTPAPASTNAPAPTSAPAPRNAPAAETEADLAAIKTYLQEYGKNYLKAGADYLQIQANAYYEEVKAANFDYQKAWGDGSVIAPLIMSMREAFNLSHSGYENVEGIVAGVPSLSEFDTILDAGSPGSEGGDGVADFTLTLPDGSELVQPGNFYHNLLEPMVYGTDPEQLALTEVDVDGDGNIGFGDALPDANRLKGAVDGFVTYVDQTVAAIDAWEPTVEDAFTAMVTMTPTMDEYFGNWKESRYVTGAESTEVRFVAHSRLVDVSEILGSLQTIYAGVEPLVQAADPATAQQINQNYIDLRAFVQNLLNSEAAGTTYTPDEAEVLGQQAQEQAQAITGQVTQAAALLGITLAEQ